MDCKSECEGSNPSRLSVSSLGVVVSFPLVAQRIGHLTTNQEAGGSSPPGRTTSPRSSAKRALVSEARGRGFDSHRGGQRRELRGVPRWARFLIRMRDAVRVRASRPTRGSSNSRTRVFEPRNPGANPGPRTETDSRRARGDPAGDGSSLTRRYAGFDSPASYQR